jgi:ABC-type Mn2+/Zn2+ transport system permease subunit
MIDWPVFLSPDARLAFWTILCGVVCNASCAIIGCYLVLRRMSLLGDAISHAVLAGIAVAFLLTGSLAPLPVFIGAVTVGLLTAFLTQSLATWGRITEDSSMGIVFTSLFAIGVIIVSQIDGVHLDTDCVLYGSIDTAPVEIITVAGYDIPHMLQILVPMTVLTLLFVIAFWKELKIASFDPLLATTMGIGASFMHYLLMAMVAGVTVSSLEAVGAIVVVAMLIVPPATAHLLTDRLGWMLVWSVAIGGVSAVLGYWGAVRFDTNVAGMMAVAAGGQFTLAVAFAPKHGLLSRAIGRMQLALRIAAEDVIAKLYRLEEQAAESTNRVDVSRKECEHLAGAGWIGRLAILVLSRRKQLATSASGQWHLTTTGRELGRSLVRSHRLWETFLDENFELPPDHLHEPAERLEHFIGPQLQARLVQELAQSRTDPQGKVIPPGEAANDSEHAAE